MLPLPKELVFRVDNKILRAIDDAVALHKQGVCFVYKLIVFQVEVDFTLQSKLFLTYLALCSSSVQQTKCWNRSIVAGVKLCDSHIHKGCMSCEKHGAGCAGSLHAA